MTDSEWKAILAAAAELPRDAREYLLEKMQWIGGGLLMQYDDHGVRVFVALLRDTA